MFIDFGPFVSTSSLSVPPGGGQTTATADEDGELVTYEVWTTDIGGGAGNNYAVYEIEAL